MIPPLVHFLWLIVAGVSLWFLIVFISDVVHPFSVITATAWGLTILFFFGHIMLGLTSKRADKALIKALIYSPKYILWKMGIYLQTLFKGREKEWIRTTRR